MRRESDCSEEKAPANGDGVGESAMRARKRKADVATFLQDPDEEVANMELTRKKQCENQPSWNSDPKNAHMLIPTPDKDDDPVGVDYSQFPHLSLIRTRVSPLPVLGWANRDDVWKNMMKKEETYVRDKFYMQRHPLLQPKMRAILLDWLMEVCEVYKLHRETFYLAQDFFDRFMATQHDVVKTLLQLIGISSLFIAAKLEEIYPPKLHQFAYVTDGACTEDEILSMELLIMKALNWNLSPLTVVSWLNIYLQIAYLNKLYEVLLPQYPQQIFVQIAEVSICCLVALGSLSAGYCVFTNIKSSFRHITICLCFPGYEWCEVEECVKWMVPFAMAIREVGSSRLKHFRGVAPEDMHNIQTHINGLDLLDKAQANKAMLSEQNRTSPFPTGVLTPPQSSKKQSSGPKPI
uniref:Cyclin E1 n=1 Tax=Amazona collaria TaxID=241587 RepID=A0A8B9F9N6_9PSIT